VQQSDMLLREFEVVFYISFEVRSENSHKFGAGPGCVEFGVSGSKSAWNEGQNSEDES
jgi:hypothetical protein